MKKFKKMLRLFVLICLIVLAGFGIGLSGGIPIPQSNKREDKTEFSAEEVDAEKEVDFRLAKF